MRVRVFQPRPGGNWLLEWRTPLRQVVRLAGFASRERSERMARRIEELGDVRDAGDELDGRLLRWAREECGDRVRERLAELGLLPQSVLVAGKSLGEHLKDFELAKMHRRKKKSTTQKASGLQVTRLRRLVNECGFTSYADMVRPGSDAVFSAWRESMRKKDSGGKLGDKSLSHQTLNHVLAAAQEFGRWMVKEERGARIAFINVSRLNVEEDRRCERRALNPKEFQSLLDAAFARDVVDRGLNGFERAALWWFVADTGLRLSEVKAVTTNHLRFGQDAAYAAVELSGQQTKNGDSLYQVVVSPGLVSMLREIASLKVPGAPMFKVGSLTRLALKKDLEAAGIGWKDAMGRQFDFHALRYQFGDRLFESGAPLNVIQKAMRHSSIELTASRYARARDESMTRAAKGMVQFRRPDGGSATGERAGNPASA